MAEIPADWKIVDTLCDRFEKAWKAGDASLEEYMAEAPPGCRGLLLRELVAVEMHYRRDERGEPCSYDDLVEAHPTLADELRAHLEQDEAFRTDQGNELDSTQRAEAKPALSDVVPVAPQEPQGLQIRCPHCSNPMELLIDTPLEEVTCKTCGSGFSLVSDEHPGADRAVLKKIGRFELISRLGMGGFGTVWKARDAELDRIVALKIPRKGQLGSLEIEYFFREARAAAQLRHPNIVAVHEIGRAEEVVFIVSDFVEGETLSEWMKKRRISPREAAALCETIATALHHAHQQGVIHRDLKPSNVMIDPNGQARIMDFGLAKREIGEVTMTVEGQILGTAAYMSPEQAAGQGHWTDRRTDIYSLGVMLFQLLTRELPFRGKLENQLYAKQMNDAPDPCKLDRHIPRDLATICLKCLERDPNRRYASAAAVADELRRFQRGEPIMARPISTLQRSWRWAKRRPALAAALVLGTILAVAGPAATVIIYLQNRQIAHQLAEEIIQVEQYKESEKALSAKNLALQQQMDALQGKVPGIEKVAPQWQNNLVEQIVTAHYDEGTDGAEPPLDSDLQRAKFHMALGYLFSQLGRRDRALEHLQLARSSLKKLQQQFPDNSAVRAALAECIAASVEQEPNEQLVSQSRDELRELRSQLAKADDAGFAEQVDLLADQWLQFDSESTEALVEMNKLAAFGQQIVAKWPTDVAAIYEAACRLTLHDPVLSRIDETQQ